MDTRMSKYDNEVPSTTRTKRNAELYKEINNSELEGFSIKSNATVLGAQEQEIDVEKIKKILDTKYNNSIKRKSIKLEPVADTPNVDNYPTKEYDLNLVIEKAKDGKDESYEEARVKKLRDTQFNILNNLHIDEKEEVENEAEEELKELINTITINEKKNKEGTAEDLDLLSDLKGSENTEVLEGLKEQIELIEKKENNIEEVDKEKTQSTTKLDKSFYTTTNMFTKSDFSDNDFLEDEKLSIWIKIVIILLILVFIAGIFVFLKSIIGF